MRIVPLITRNPSPNGRFCLLCLIIKTLAIFAFTDSILLQYINYMYARNRVSMTRSHVEADYVFIY